MNFLIAQWKKEIVSAPFLVGAWAVCGAICLLQRLQSAPLISPHVGGSDGLIGAGGFLFSFLLFLVLSILFVRVIHEDPLTDDSAFWRTRPVSRWQLLAAKAGLLFPMVAISLLVSGESVLHSWMAVCLFFLGLTAFLSVSSSFGGGLGIFLLVVIGAGCVPALIHTLTNSDLVWGSHHWHLQVNNPFPFVTDHAGAISHALFLLGLPLVIVHQYRTLRTRVSIGLLAAVFFLAWLV
jgi:hypothetical protein